MAKAPSSAGRLKAKVRFEAREDLLAGSPAWGGSSPTEEDYGNTEGTWQTQFTRWADIQPLRGGEAVMAARLEGKQPVLIIVRRDSDTKGITTDWRAVEIMPDATERSYNIRAGDDMERDNRFVTLLAERGVADG